MVNELPSFNPEPTATVRGCSLAAINNMTTRPAFIPATISEIGSY
jgi:hypothetical protein